LELSKSLISEESKVMQEFEKTKLKIVKGATKQSRYSISRNSDVGLFSIDGNNKFTDQSSTSITDNREKFEELNESLKKMLKALKQKYADQMFTNYKDLFKTILDIQLNAIPTVNKFEILI
jgi:hypothetical protein